MIIKLQEHADSLRYLIIENAKDVRYETFARFYTDNAEFDEAMVREQGSYKGTLRTETWLHNANKPRSTKDPVSLNFLRFVNADNAEVSVWFDGEAFVCNNDGKTIQRINCV